jgi:hypothetical protein
MASLTISALCLALFACGVSTPASRTAHPVGPVPPSTWSFTFAGDCSDERLVPALFCANGPGYRPTKRWCSWRCPKEPVQ